MLKDISEGEGDLTRRIKVLSKDETGDLAIYFNKFIGNVMQIMKQIRSAAEQIAEHLEIPAATLSFHLKELTNSGLVDQHRQGRSLIYRLKFESMRALFVYLMEDCCQGRPDCQTDFKDRD